jgi:Icc-related predicted phosphoesterase
MKLLFSSDLHGREEAYRDFAARLKEGDFDLGVLAGDLMSYPSAEAVETAAAERARGCTPESGGKSDDAEQAAQLALLRMHLFGHIHQSFGIDGTRVNGAYPSSRKFVGVDVDRAGAWVLP